MLSIDPALLFLLFLGLGTLCGYHAKKRGRSFFAWFVIGASFGLLGLLLLYLLPSSKKQSDQRPMPYPRPSPDEPLRLWHYLDSEANRKGPMSVYALSEAWIQQKIHQSTYVWNETMKDWTRIADIPDLMHELKLSTQAPKKESSISGACKMF